MPLTTRTLLALAGAALFALPQGAVAADGGALNCSVNVDYVRDDTVQESYQRDFTVALGVDYTEDFSTATRQKSFSATVVRDAGTLSVTIDYFNDVGVFHTVGFNTRLTMRTNFEISSGSQFFSTSQGVAGNHFTNYTLGCSRA